MEPQRVLIVEDDPLTREAMKRLLEKAGYEVSCAANGRQALEYLHHGSAPGLVLLDLNMPVMDGATFRREQRRDPFLAKIPVILVSGESDVVLEMASLGAAEFLEKPVEHQRLLEKVREWLTPDFGQL